MRDTTEPSDADRVHLVLQLGWASAELRGRCRQVLIGLPQQATPRPIRKDFTLPLNNERSSGELVHQAEKEALTVIDKLTSLGADLDVNFAMQKLPYQAATATGHVLDALPKLCQPMHPAKSAVHVDKESTQEDKESCVQKYQCRGGINRRVRSLRHHKRGRVGRDQGRRECVAPQAPHRS